MMARRLRRWHDIKTTLIYFVVFCVSLSLAYSSPHIHLHIMHQTISQCWVNIRQAGPILTKHWLSVSCGRQLAATQQFGLVFLPRFVRSAERTRNNNNWPFWRAITQWKEPFNKRWIITHPLACHSSHNGTVDDSNKSDNCPLDLP